MKTTVTSSNANSSYQYTGKQTITGTPRRLGSSGVAQDRRQAPPIHLTPRESEVLLLLCEGLPNKLICRHLNISLGTVKIHIGSILSKLGVSSRLQAVVAARRLGLIDDAMGTAGPADYSSPAADPMIPFRLDQMTSRRLAA